MPEANAERQLLRESVRDFVGKNIESRAASIEKEGIDGALTRKLVEQGILGASISTGQGGAGLDRGSYVAVLEELAWSSPSVAVRILITNSLFAPLVSRNEALGGSLFSAATGKTNVAVAHLGLLGGEEPGISLAGGRVGGREEYLLNSEADSLVSRAGGDAGELLLIHGGLRRVREHPRLGLRGLRFSSVEVDTGDYETICADGSSMIRSVLDGIDLELAAISLGMASRALSKAAEYSSARKAFDNPLKDYQGVAFPIALLRSEEQFLRRFVESSNLTAAEEVMARVRALELVKNATRHAVQVHGGYGYFEDFGVSRFYRDSMALSILFRDGTADMERLAGLVYSSRSGFL